MSSDTPNWQAFTPSGAAIPSGAAGDGPLPELSVPLPAVGETLPLVVSPGLETSPWVAECARDLVSRAGREVAAPLLIDLSLERPFFTDMGPGEGLSDAFRFAASLPRIIRREEDGLELVTAGSPVADPREVLADPGWEVIRERLHLEQRGAYLLVPLDQTGARAFLRDFESAVLLCTEQESNLGAIRAARSWSAIVGPPSDPIGVSEMGDDLADEESARAHASAGHESGTGEDSESLRVMGDRLPHEDSAQAGSIQLGAVGPEPVEPDSARADEVVAKASDVEPAKDASGVRRSRAAREKSSVFPWVVFSVLILIAVLIMLLTFGVIDLPMAGISLSQSMLPIDMTEFT